MEPCRIRPMSDSGAAHPSSSASNAPLLDAHVCWGAPVASGAL